MTNLKLFTVILFLSVLSNSAFALDENEIDPIDHEITIGKIDAAEHATAIEKSKILIQQALKAQEDLGTNTIDMSGKFSAIGQLITALEHTINEVDSTVAGTEEIMKLNQELEELLK